MTTSDRPGGSARRELANAAFRQAARRAVERAAITNTPVIIWKDGRTQEVNPNELADVIEPPPPPQQN